MINLLCYDGKELKQIEFEDDHFIFQNSFVQLLDLKQPITISYKLLLYLKIPI